MTDRRSPKFKPTKAFKEFKDDCQQLLTERGQANSVAIAQAALKRYAKLSPQAKAGFFDYLATHMDPDPGDVLRLAEQYAVNRSPETLLNLTRAAEPPRQELLRRLNRTQGGAGQLVTMRADLLAHMKNDRRLSAVDADFEHLFNSWFNPGFLQMQKIDWGSSAQLLEQIIAHEAVHEIDGWSDLRRRLEPDRRCFAFFHPTLPNEPLIFVEIALLVEIPDAIAPLISRQTKIAEPNRARVAAFYSISNCQPGLRGVSLGNFLIKRVAQALKAEFPKLNSFCTLSPIPGFASWLSAAQKLASKQEARPVFSSTSTKTAALEALNELLQRENLDEPALQSLCAFYLLHSAENPGHELLVADPVARFHLNNGARLDRINPNADMSRKGLKQSHGFMVNYVYDLDLVEENHEKFVRGEVTASRTVRSMI
jgi:malonyl-CoA decarboxylase